MTPLARRALTRVLMLAVLVAASCGRAANPEQDMARDDSKETAALEERLLESSYRELVQMAGGESGRALWDSAEPGAFERLLSDPRVDTRAVFLAAELAAHYELALWRAADKDVLARAYADALAKDYVGMGNVWWLPSYSAEVAGRLLKLREHVAPLLIELLSDDTPVQFGGSADAGLAEAYQVRVKDIAAHFLGIIRMKVFRFVKDPAVRDREIERLRTQL